MGGGRAEGRGCSGWGGWGVDMNKELKFLRKFTKKIRGGGGGGGAEGGGVRVGGGQSGCEQRSEVFLKIQKKTF